MSEQMEHDVGSSRQGFDLILRTKLHRPQLPKDLVRRDRLIEVMGRAHGVPLTLVSAPAGYGKSVLVAQWAEQHDGPVGWLSLDAGDSELRAFLQYFLAAVDTVSPDTCDATRELLAASVLVPVPVLADYLLNDLDAMDRPCSIVLDDYQRIEPLSPVHDLMLRMLEHPPAQFHLVVATRQDPPIDLPGLRAAHRINEVRLQDLQFTGRETSEFLSATSDHSVGDEALGHMQQEVEGWAAGLRLVSLALRHVRETDDFLKKLPSRLPEIQEYLLREVLAAQAAEVRDRMLASSILDRFCAGVLDAVCEPPHTDDQTGLAAAEFLKELHEGNLFTVSLDAGREWFRYHHLFQDLLVHELERLRGPGHVAALHLRASEWFEGEGLIEEALKHAVAADDMERAAQVVARHRHSALNVNEWIVLANWLSLIPETVARQHAELLLARVWISLNYLFRFEPVPALMEQAEALLVAEPGDEGLLGELALCRGYVLWLKGDSAGGLKDMEVALQKIPVEHVEFRSTAEIIFAVCCQMVGQRERAVRYLDVALAQSDPVREVRRRTRLFYSQVFIHLVAAELPAAELAQRRLRDLAERSGSPYERAWTDYMHGVIHLYRCEWDAAVEFLTRSTERRFIHNRRAAADSFFGLMLAYRALGRDKEASESMRSLQDYVATQGDPEMDNLVMSAEARLAILEGRPEPARRWLAASEPPAEAVIFFWVDMPSISRCQAMAAVGEKADIEQAEARLLDLAGASEGVRNALQLARVLALLAMAYDKQGKREEALSTLERAVTIARKGDLLLPFVELGTPMVELLRHLPSESQFAARVEHLVAAFGAPTDGSTKQRLDEPHVVAGRNLVGLTNREVDVLEMLALRLQNKEIADRLSISDQTVGSHLKQIYQKLGVHGRRKAVQRAIEKGILSP